MRNVRGRADANGLKMTLFAAFLRRSAPAEAEGGESNVSRFSDALRMVRYKRR